MKVTHPRQMLLCFSNTNMGAEPNHLSVTLHYVSMSENSNHQYSCLAVNTCIQWRKISMFMNLFPWMAVTSTKFNIENLLTCKQGRCGNLSFILYLSRKYFATVHSTVWPFSSCNGKLKGGSVQTLGSMFSLTSLYIDFHFFINIQSFLGINIFSKWNGNDPSSLLIAEPLCYPPPQLTYDCICAGLLVTLHTRYFLRIAPQCVISIWNKI